MADAPTQADLFQAARRRILLTENLRFNPAIVDVEGSDVNVLLQSGASIGEDIVRFLVTALNELALSTAREEALDRWVYDRYQLTRFEAQTAVAELSLTRTDTAPVTVPAGSTFATETGVSFTTIADAVFASGNQGPILVNAVAVRAGTEGNVSAGSITVVTAALDDATIDVTNDDPAAGGRDEETDEELRARAREFFVTARRGTRAAIEFGALQTASVAQATAVEQLNTSTGEPQFRVQLNIADSNGQANTALAAEVTEGLDEYRALGVPVSVIPAVPEFVDITIDGLEFEAGANTSSVLSNARAAILAAVNGLAPTEPLRLNLIELTLGDVDQLIVPEGSIVEPTGDLLPTLGTVIRTTSAQIVLNGT